ncbi:MAG TPA: NAD(P)/FAD-dependent oxidoreductase [Thermoanaerobaculia bacterium]
MKHSFDVIIIGAGAAGLAAAREISGAGKSVAVLEARPRIGGRILTTHVPDLPLPIELGAEFIHGEAPETLAIVQAAALVAYQLPADQWWSAQGKMSRIHDFWGSMQRLLKRIPSGAHDISFAEFLDRQRNLSPRSRKLALAFVEGYYASHADRISAASLRVSGGEEEERKQFRIANGYDAVLQWLRAGIDPQHSEMRLGTEVTEVRWKRGKVVVQTRGGEVFRASAAVITIPLGVWKSPDGITFEPALRDKQRAIEKLEVGHVVKIVFRFRARFWEEDGRPRNFVHAADRLMPTWWTTAPVRAPLLTGWAGGQGADALLAEGTAAIPDLALDSLATTFGRKRREIESLVDSVHLHDWQADPFSRGAYSYTGVGGQRAHAALAKSVAGTLFFAGEATSSDETGTVSGAIVTGKRAAKQLLRGIMP